MKLTSPAFSTNTPLPADATCQGKGVHPPLVIKDVPTGAQSLVLIMHDPDAVGGRDFLHWLVWNIPPHTAQIPEGISPAGATEGTNDYPEPGYGPACPPAGSGLHHYVFELYALDTPLNVPLNAGRQAVERAMQGHILATAQLVGLVNAKAA